MSLRTSEKTVGRDEVPALAAAAAPPPVTRRAPSCRPRRMCSRTRLALGGRDERAHLRGGVERVAEDVRLRDRGRDRLGFGEPLARDHQPGEGDAGLAAVEHAARHARRDGQLEVGVVEHDAGRLAAELERGGHQVAPGDLADPAADALGPGERHEVDAGMAGERLAHDLPVAGDEVQDAGRQPDLVADLRQRERRTAA